MTETISQMTPGIPPYALTTLLELSIAGPTTVSGNLLDIVQSATNGGLTKGLNLPFNPLYINTVGSILALGTPSSYGSGYAGGSAAIGLSALTAGTSYVPGYYAAVPLTDTTNGLATGVTANIIVGSDGLVKSATIATYPAQTAGYAVGDALTCANTYLGGSGSGWQILVGTIGAIYQSVALSGGNGTGATATFTVSGAGPAAIHTVSLVNKGVAYLPTDVLGVNPANVGGTGSGFSVGITGVGSAPSAANSILWESGTVSGSISASASFGPASVAPFNSVSLYDETNNNVASVPIAALGIYDKVGAVGGSNRVAFVAFCDAEGAPTTPNVNYTGGWFFAKGSVPSGNNGYVFGCNPQGAIGQGATGWKAVSAGEADVTASIGSNPLWKMGWIITTTGSDAVHGSAIDSGLHIAAIGNTQNPTNGFLTGILFADNNGAFPVPPLGTMISTNSTLLGTPTVMNGIDFSGVTFSNAFLLGPGSFKVDGSANITANSLNLGSTTASVATVQTLNMSAASAPTPPAGGYGVNALTSTNALQLWAGGNMVASCNNAGTITLNHSRAGVMGLTIDNTNTGATTQANLIFGNSTSGSQAAITLNGGSYSGGAGANALVISNGAGALIEIGSGSEVVEFGSSGSWTANGTSSPTLGALGVSGHTTVVGWLTFKNSAGTTVYVPCF